MRVYFDIMDRDTDPGRPVTFSEDKHSGIKTGTFQFRIQEKKISIFIE